MSLHENTIISNKKKEELINKIINEFVDEFFNYKITACTTCNGECLFPKRNERKKNKTKGRICGFQCRNIQEYSNDEIQKFKTEMIKKLKNYSKNNLDISSNTLSIFILNEYIKKNIIEILG